MSLCRCENMVQLPGFLCAKTLNLKLQNTNSRDHHKQNKDRFDSFLIQYNASFWVVQSATASNTRLQAEADNHKLTYIYQRNCTFRGT
jgi:hypothetical protein